MGAHPVYRLLGIFMPRQHSTHSFMCKIVTSAQVFGTLFPADASSPTYVVPVHSWTVTTDTDTAILLSADVSPYVGHTHHAWTFSLLLETVNTEINVGEEQHYNFVICVSADAAPNQNTRFSFVDGDILCFYVDETGGLPQLHPIPTAHVVAVSESLKNSGYFLRGIQHLNCAACEDGQGVVLVKYDVG